MEDTEGAPHSLVQRVGLFAGIAVFLVFALGEYFFPTLIPLGPAVARSAGVTLCMVIFWLTEALPLWATSLIPLFAYPLLSIRSGTAPSQVVASAKPYVDGYIFLFLGGMALGAGIEEVNLHKRIALEIMKRVGTSPKRLLYGVLLSTALISMWISNTATAVMMLPIASAVALQVESQANRKAPRFTTALLLAVAYASNIGGMGTKIGTATNSIFCGYMADVAKIDIGFLQFVGIGMPLIALLLPLTAFLLARYAKLNNSAAAEIQLKHTESNNLLDQEIKALGPMVRAEKMVAILFCTAAVLWVVSDLVRPGLSRAFGFSLSGKHYEMVVALTMGALLFATRAIRLSALRRIPVSALLLLGGSFAMAEGLESSGLSQLVGAQLKAVSNLPWALQLFIASSAAVLLTAVASNTATVNLLLHLLPQKIVLLSVVTLGASSDFALPAGTPPNAIVFGTGKIPIRVMMRTGALVDVSSVLILTLYGLTYLQWFLSR